MSNIRARIARRLLRIARELVALNENVDRHEIAYCRRQFEKELRDEGNWENHMNGGVPGEETIQNSLEVFDRLMKQTLDNSSFTTLYPDNLVDRYKEMGRGKVAPQCANILYKLFNDEAKMLHLKTFRH